MTALVLLVPSYPWRNAAILASPVWCHHTNFYNAFLWQQHNLAVNLVCNDAVRLDQATLLTSSCYWSQGATFTEVR